MRRLVLSLCSVALVGGGLVHSADPTAWQHERKEWNLPLRGLRTVSVANTLGDVRVRAWNGEEVAIIAHLQAPEGHPLPEVKTAGGENTVTIQVAASGEAGRADLTVMAPADCVFEIEGDDDLIEVKGMAAALTATTVSGAVSVRGAGAVRLTSAQGAIGVVFTATDWDGVSRIETATGEVEVHLPRHADVEVSMVSEGLLSTDYSIDVQPTGLREAKRARALVGAGAAALEIVSERGGITLRRSFWPSATPVPSPTGLNGS